MPGYTGRMGVTPTLTRAEAVELYFKSRELPSADEIARRAGVSRQTLYLWVKAENEKAPRPGTATGPTTNPEGSVTDGSAKPDSTEPSTTKDTGGK